MWIGILHAILLEQTAKVMNKSVFWKIKKQWKQSQKKLGEKKDNKKQWHIFDANTQEDMPSIEKKLKQKEKGKRNEKV